MRFFPSNDGSSPEGVNLPKGVFTLSLDFELIWGTIDKRSWRSMQPLYAIEREEVIGRLLELFDRYSVSATWCTVGHLFLDRCSNSASPRHSEIDPQGLDPRFDRDPCSGESADPIFYGRRLLEQILACPTPQEIGCHSFSHPDFATCSRERAQAELAASVRAARELGIDMSSFAFPRNRVGHLDLFPRYGFRTFRGPDRTWYEQAPRRKSYHRAGHLLDILLAAEPPTVLPEWNENGLWDIPGSMLYTPSHRLRRYIPVQLRVLRAQKGLRAAARHRRVFHLWFHPTDVVVRQRAMLDGLARILDLASELRERNRLVILPMFEVPRYAGLPIEGPAPALAGVAR